MNSKRFHVFTKKETFFSWNRSDFQEPTKINNDKTLYSACHIPTVFDISTIIIVVSSALAIALGHLYHDDIDLAHTDVVHVLAAARCLHFQHLIHRYVMSHSYGK